MNTFAERLKYAMEQADLKQSALSEQAGISKAAISQYLSGKNTPNQERIKALADVTGVTFDFLMGYGAAPVTDAPPPVKKISVKEAARCMGKSDQFVRIGLQRGLLPFGNAVPGTGNNWNYYINVTLPTNTLNDNDWATIKQVSDSGKGSSYWAVGDMKSIQINGKVGNFTFSNLTINTFILGFNHNSGKEGNNKIHFQIGKIGTTAVALCDSQYNSNQNNNGYFNMNPNNSNSGGWKESYMRKTLLGNTGTPTSPPSNSLLAALPSALRNVMKPVTKYTDNVGNNTGNTQSNVTSTTDYLFLLAEYEVFGSRSYANSYEQNYQVQYDYYKAGNSKVANNHTSTTSAVWWWLRSPRYGGSNYFCNVTGNGHSTNTNAYYSAGVRPGFAV